MKNRTRNLEFHILWLPFLVLFFIFTVLPIISSVVLSFTDFDAVSMPKFVGLENYFRMFTSDEVLPVSLKNTVLFGRHGMALLCSQKLQKDAKDRSKAVSEGKLLAPKPRLVFVAHEFHHMLQMYLHLGRNGSYDHGRTAVKQG